MIIKYLRYSLTALVIALAMVCQAHVTDLPVKKVNGRDYYYYTVRSTDTPAGIIQNLGISREVLKHYNPSCADGVRTGMVLYFPVSDFGDAVAASDNITRDNIRTHVVKSKESLFGIAKKYGVTEDEIIALNPNANGIVKAGDILIIPVRGTSSASASNVSEPDRSDEEVPVVVAQPIDPDAQPRELKPVNPEVKVLESPKRRYTVAIMLPFMLDEEQPSKGAVQTLDFYKGFLLAVDSLGHSSPEVDIHVYDTKNNIAYVRDLLKNDKKLSEADIIVAPDNVEQLSVIAEFAKRDGIYVLNNVSVRDSSYLTNPYILQSPVPTSRMYSAAIEDLVNTLDGRIPVILNNESGRGDKQAFIDELLGALARRGILPTTVTYNGTLAVSTLSEQLPDPIEGTRYIFLSGSGSLNEFNKYSVALQKYKTELNGIGADLSVYGYPEWVTFRNDALDALHDLGATIYSRSFDDSGSYASRKVRTSFVNRYGRDMAEGVPSQGILGFDTANFIFHALSNGGFDAPIDMTDWDGVQSTYHLRPAGEGAGAVNEAVYIIRYLPGNVTEVKVL